jgi:hypothetical protein
MDHGTYLLNLDKSRLSMCHEMELNIALHPHSVVDPEIVTGENENDSDRFIYCLASISPLFQVKSWLQKHGHSPSFGHI